MSEEVFIGTGDAGDEWVDVRMTDPEKGEWDIDVVVVDGRVEYVDLRIRPGLLAEFVDCLVEDVGCEQASAVLSTVADRQNVELDTDTAEQ